MIASQIVASALIAVSAHAAPVYQFSGDVTVRPHHPAVETVTVNEYAFPRCASAVTVYAESADGQDSTFAGAAFDRRHHRWVARIEFTYANETGTWSAQAVGDRCHSDELMSLDWSVQSFAVRH